MIGIISIALLAVYGGVGDSFESASIDDEGRTNYKMEISFYQRDYIPVNTLTDEGRYSKFATQDIQVGIESNYAFIFALNQIFESLCKFVYRLAKGKDEDDEKTKKSVN